MSLQVRHSELRAEYAKPWLEWAVSLLYVLALDLKRLQVLSHVHCFRQSLIFSLLREPPSLVEEHRQLLG